MKSLLTIFERRHLLLSKALEKQEYLAEITVLLQKTGEKKKRQRGLFGSFSQLYQISFPFCNTAA